jgi:DNA-binding response OmpR family regulator
VGGRTVTKRSSSRSGFTDLIILDLMLPGERARVLTQLREYLPVAETRVIVMSAWGHADQAASAPARTALFLPFEPDELTAIVTEVLTGAEENPCRSQRGC